MLQRQRRRRGKLLVRAPSYQSPRPHLPDSSVGFGASNIVPVLFSAAGRVPGIPAIIALATVTTIPTRPAGRAGAYRPRRQRPACPAAFAIVAAMLAAIAAMLRTRVGLRDWGPSSSSARTRPRAVYLF